jgi:hypothetical protein
LNFKVEIPVKVKIGVNERTLEQILNFDYLDFNMGSGKEMDINAKIQRLQHICGQIIRTLVGKF